MKVEVRANGSVHISGYVNAVGRDSRVLGSPRGKFVEQVEPRAFSEAIAKNPDVKLMHNHTRYVSGTLKLVEDAIGLHADADTSDAEIVAEARAGNLRGWSFGFQNPVDEFEETESGIPRRHLRGFDLSEVSIIDSHMTPCYIGTSIETRADAEIITETRAANDDTVETDIIAPDYSIERKKIKIRKMRSNT